MSSVFWQIIFVVWRESVEALLVIGILNAWLGRQVNADVTRTARRFLWGGVAAGAAAACVLAWCLVALADWLDDERQEYFQMCMVLVAAALILQMVYWLRSHAGGLKGSLEQGAERLAAQASWWGLALLAAIAVMREGSETVLFLYGIVAGSSGKGAGQIAAGISVGVALAGATYFLLQAGAKHLSWKLFFTVTEIMLLFLAASLLMTGLDRAISLDLLSPMSGPLWNTAWLLNDSGGFGSIVAALTGYRAQPQLLPVLVYASYWLLVVGMLFVSRSPKLKTA